MDSSEFEVPRVRGARMFWLGVLLLVLLTAGLFALVTHLHMAEEADKAECKANLRQIGVGLLKYANDYGGHMPVRPAAGEPLGKSDPMRSLSLLLPRYVPCAKTFVCKASGDPIPGATDCVTLLAQPHLVDKSPRDGLVCSFGYDDTKGLHSTPAKAQADVAVMADAPHRGMLGYTHADCNSDNHRSDGQNVLYLDGRVAWHTTPEAGFDHDNIFMSSDPLPGPTDSRVIQVIGPVWDGGKWLHKGE
jgi:hypothetical protein